MITRVKGPSHFFSTFICSVNVLHIPNGLSKVDKSSLEPGTKGSKINKGIKSDMDSLVALTEILVQVQWGPYSNF